MSKSFLNNFIQLDEALDDGKFFTKNENDSTNVDSNIQITSSNSSNTNTNANTNQNNYDSSNVSSINNYLKATTNTAAATADSISNNQKLNKRKSRNQRRQTSKSSVPRQNKNNLLAVAARNGHKSALNISKPISSSPTSSSSSTSNYTLEQFISDIIKFKFKRILVLAGAGISTPSGIPDFRTPGTGIYDNLNKFNIPYPEAIFDKEYFQRNPKPFFKIAKDLFPNVEKYKPNKIHFFFRLLQEKNILQRLYTQNIDSLETLAGIKSDKLIEAHGSFRTAKCTKCFSFYPGVFVESAIINDKMPSCKNCRGIVKPDIVFFGEDLPEKFYRTYKKDFLLTDLVIVLGTSLEVEPFASIIDECPSTVPRVLMNRCSVGPFKKSQPNIRKKDLMILGDLISCLEMLIKRIGWEDELNEIANRELNNLKTKKQSEIFENRNKLNETPISADERESDSLSTTNKNTIEKSTMLDNGTNTKTQQSSLFSKTNIISNNSSNNYLINTKNLIDLKLNEKPPVLFPARHLNRDTVNYENKNYFVNIFEKYRNIEKRNNAYVDISIKEETNPCLAQDNKMNSNLFKRESSITTTNSKMSHHHHLLDKTILTQNAQNNFKKKFLEFNDDGRLNGMKNDGLYTNNTLYTANSKPLLNKTKLETFQLAKVVNMDNLNLVDIENKNDEILKNFEKFKIYL